MKKVMVLIMFFCSFVCAMEQQAAREKYGRCLSSATGKHLWHHGYSFPGDTYYKVHLKCCMLEYQRGIVLDCSLLKQGKAIEDHAGCVAYCENNLSWYGRDNQNTCLRQCALVYRVNDQLKK